MSDEENENNTDIDPIEVTIAAGATLSSPARVSISRKRKIHINEGKYKRGSSSSTLSSRKGNTTGAWDHMKDYPKQHFAAQSCKYVYSAEIRSLITFSTCRAMCCNRTCCSLVAG